MTAPTTAPAVTAAAIRGARTRLRGCIVLDVADLSTTAAVYDPRGGLFYDLTGAELGPDDGSLVVLFTRDDVDELVAATGRPCDAAAAATRTIRDQYRKGLL